MSTLPQPPNGACWPDHQDALLLRACLLPDNRGAEAYRAWRAAVDLQTMRPQWLRLMPLLQHNLRRLSIADPEQELLRGVSRRSWFTAQVATSRATPVLQQMATHGIPTMILKGAALAELYYQNPALRPMEDLDVCVPAQHAQEAFQLMGEMGYRPADYGFAPTFQACQLRSHAWGFRAQNDHELDLHWHVLPAAQWADADREFWAANQPLALGASETRTLSAEDHLLQACVHGTTWNHSRIIHWIADVATLVERASDRLSARALIGRAHKLGVLSHLKTALLYVHDLLGVLPQTMVAAMREARPSFGDHMTYLYRRSPRGTSTAAMASQLLLWHRERQPRGVRRWLGFPAYLRAYWQCSSNWDMATRAGRAVWLRAAGGKTG